MNNSKVAVQQLQNSSKVAENKVNIQNQLFYVNNNRRQEDFETKSTLAFTLVLKKMKYLVLNLSKYIHIYMKKIINEPNQIKNKQMERFEMFMDKEDSIVRINSCPIEFMQNQSKSQQIIFWI